MHPAPVTPVIPLESGVDSHADLRQLVQVGALSLVVGFDEAREYLDNLSAPIRVPRAPNWLLGISGQGGWAVPVVDLSAWLGQPVSLWQDGTASSAVSHSVPLRVLRMLDGVDAWALRLNAAPVVVNLTQAQAKETDWPLELVALYSSLLPYAVRAWQWPDLRWAVQLRWAAVADALKQELSTHALGQTQKEHDA